MVNVPDKQEYSQNQKKLFQQPKTEEKLKEKTTQ